jgi:hypothetical protein
MKHHIKILKAGSIKLCNAKRCSVQRLRPPPKPAFLIGLALCRGNLSHLNRGLGGLKSVLNLPNDLLFQ